MTANKGNELTENELNNLKLIQHSMGLEGHEISIEELIEVKKASLAEGDTEKIQEVLIKAKAEGISQLDAARKYFFKEESPADEQS